MLVHVVTILGTPCSKGLMLSLHTCAINYKMHDIVFSIRAVAKKNYNAYFYMQENSVESVEPIFDSYNYTKEFTTL